MEFLFNYIQVAVVTKHFNETKNKDVACKNVIGILSRELSFADQMLFNLSQSLRSGQQSVHWLCRVNRLPSKFNHQGLVKECWQG